MRLLRAWEWENIWSVWTVLAMLVGPLVVAACTVPQFISINQTIGWQVLLFTAGMGFISGISGFLFSYTVPVVGIGLASSLNAGGSLAVSLLPLLVLHSRTIAHRSGIFTLAGVGISVWGLWFCGKGGSLRDKELAEKKGAEKPNHRFSFAQCIALNVIAGSISSSMNVFLAFPNPIFAVAHDYKLTEFQTAVEFLAPYMVGGFFSNIFYTTYVLRKNHTFSRFYHDSLRCFAWTALMAMVFLIGTISYAYSVELLGSFGAIITWGVSGAAMIVFSTLWDVTLGQWYGKAARKMAMGVAVLLTSIIVLGMAQYFYQINPSG